MEQIPYNGTWITCGSYALIHAANLGYQYMLPAENCAGATFGVASLESEWGYTRILTPIFDFNCGIDESAYLWGIDIEHYICNNFEEYRLKYDKDKNANYVIGPINMAALRYLPLSQQYYCSDHYIALLKRGENCYIKDSEGVPYLKITTAKLNDLLVGGGIPESGGRLHIRKILCNSKIFPSREWIAYALKKGNANLKKAKELKQGPEAFKKCKEIIQNAVPALWEESLIYSLNHIAQRRLMIQRLIKRINDDTAFEVEGKLEVLLDKQIMITANAKYELAKKNLRNVCTCLTQLYETEDELTEKWDVWICCG